MYNYLFAGPGVLVTATVPAMSNGIGGRVITGIARDDANSRLTPVARAMPAPRPVIASR